MKSSTTFPTVRAYRTVRQAGFTLVELMIAMVIGLFIVLALITLLINVNRNNSEMTKTNRVIENGRIALQLLTEDVSHAGFWGGHIPKFDDLTATAAPGDVPTDSPDPCLPYTAANWNATHLNNLVGVGLQAYQVNSPVDTPALPVCAGAGGTTNFVPNVKAGTDVLVVRHAETCAAGVAGCAALKPASLYFQASRCATDAAPFLLEPYDAATYNISTLALLRRDCGVASFVEVRKLISNLYYVRDFAVTAGDGVPTLMRSELDVTSGVPTRQPAQAIIEGIEGFRVELGIDNVSDSGEAVVPGAAIIWADAANRNSPRNRGDGNVDGAYVHCNNAGCPATQLINAVAVKLYVLVRSERTTPGYIDSKTYKLGAATLGPFSDGYKRHLFTQTVRLNNVASRRETP